MTEIERYLEDNGVTVQDISDALGKSRTTIYTYLGDKRKETLIKNTAKDILESRRKKIDEMLNKKPIDVTAKDSQVNAGVNNSLIIGEAQSHELISYFLKRIRDLEGELEDYKRRSDKD